LISAINCRYLLLTIKCENGLPHDALLRRRWRDQPSARVICMSRGHHRHTHAHTLKTAESGATNSR